MVAAVRAGWWAVALVGPTAENVALILLARAVGVVELPDGFTDNWAFSLWGLAIWATGMARVVAGVVATTRRHERSWMVEVATLLELLPVALLLSEAALGKV